MSIILTPTEEISKAIKNGVRVPLPLIRDPTRTLSYQHRMAIIMENYLFRVVERYNDFARDNDIPEILKKNKSRKVIKQFAEESTRRRITPEEAGEMFEDFFEEPEIMNAQERAAAQMTDLVFDIRDTASRRVHTALRDSGVRQEQVPDPNRARARVTDTIRRNVEGVDAVARSLATGIQETVQRHIDRPIGVGEEIQRRQLERDILDQVDRARARVWQITRTEVINAYNLFSVESARAHGIERFSWQSARGDPATPHGNVVCPVCTNFHNKVRMWGQPFGGNQRVASFRLITRPPAHPNCRCTLIPVLEAEIVPPEFLR